MKIQALILTTALAVPMALVGQSPRQNNATDKNWNNSSQLSNHDRLFLHTLSSEDQSEIDLAKLALQKSTNPQVQQYAKSKILAADPSMEQGALRIAQQDHSPVSAAPNATDKAEYKDLAKLSGKEFDRAYMRYESRQQSADLTVVQNEVTSATNSQVSSFARKEETPVRQAAQSANQIARSLGVSTRS